MRWYGDGVSLVRPSVRSLPSHAAHALKAVRVLSITDSLPSRITSTYSICLFFASFAGPKLGISGWERRRTRTQRTVCAGIAQLSRDGLSELLCSKEASKTVWSCLRSGESPFESPSGQGPSLTSKQQTALAAFDHIFAEAMRPEAVALQGMTGDEMDECKGEARETREREGNETPLANVKGLHPHVSQEQDLKDGSCARGDGFDGRRSLTESLTRKFLLRLYDGLSVESVLIPPAATTKTSKTAFTKATTICISSQVGCAQACQFCRTGRMGLLRNLQAEEMIAQVVQGRRIAKELGLPKVLKVVFMGMGEPLANLKNVKLAVEALGDLQRMGFARKRLQISTVAPSPSQIRALKGMRCQVVWSVHSAQDSLRSQLVPTSGFPMMELRDAFMDLLKTGGGKPDPRFMVAVVMIAGVNDKPRHAIELADFLRPLYDDPAINLSVNLIPYNQSPEHDKMAREEMIAINESELDAENAYGSGFAEFAAPDPESIKRFREQINEVIPSLAIHIRQTRGAESWAACGQLATATNGVKRTLQVLKRDACGVHPCKKHEIALTLDIIVDLYYIILYYIYTDSMDLHLNTCIDTHRLCRYFVTMILFLTVIDCISYWTFMYVFLRFLDVDFGSSCNSDISFYIFMFH